jgi:tRNA threonylcarbamoyl adenosine modification protein YjeE
MISLFNTYLSMGDQSYEPVRVTLASKAEFDAFAALFARRLRPGDVVALSGPLGSGKTAFVRAIVRTLHGTDQSCSPTFTFWHHYGGDPPIDHLDFFRIDDQRETAELGLEEALDGRSVVLVESWRNAPGVIPSWRYEIEIEGAGNEPRVVSIREAA